ncbi:DNA polymerase III subunit tau [compost metagenome]
MHDLWVEKYRPDTLDGYVFKDKMMEIQIREWIDNPDKKRIPIPNLMLSGVQGTGKTTLARILINLLGVEAGDILEINASRENGVETIRNKIVNFCGTWPVGEYKVILLDEVDRMSQDAQGIMRNEIEKYADSVRFIMTCNYPHKIMPALHSRMQSFHINKLDIEAFMERMISILITENIEFNPDDIEQFVSFSYPDLRKCINLLDQFSKGGKLHPMETQEETSLDYMEKFAELFRERKFLEARMYICGIAKTDEYDQIYRYFYTHLDMFSANLEGQKNAVLTIASGLRNHALCADSEINLAATVIQLSEIQ